jgi:hypothetical protein
MKYTKLVILLFVIAMSTPSCNTERNLTKNKINNESYIKYLSSVINDTIFFELPELKIVDSSIYPILDSVILWSEKCIYFDARIKNLYSFRFAARSENGKFLYFTDAHLSPAGALGITLIEAGIIKQLNIGIFYYKHYSFIVPMANYREQKELEYFTFVKKSGNKLNIRAPKFIDEKVYASYITFDKQDDSYKIKENEICGGQILIQ